jgi:hypothetical protein
MHARYRSIVDSGALKFTNRNGKSVRTPQCPSTSLRLVLPLPRLAGRSCDRHAARNIQEVRLSASSGRSDAWRHFREVPDSDVTGLRRCC